MMIPSFCWTSQQGCDSNMEEAARHITHATTTLIHLLKRGSNEFWRYEKHPLNAVLMKAKAETAQCGVLRRC